MTADLELFLRGLYRPRRGRRGMTDVHRANRQFERMFPNALGGLLGWEGP